MTIVQILIELVDRIVFKNVCHARYPLMKSSCKGENKLIFRISYQKLAGLKQLPYIQLYMCLFSIMNIGFIDIFCFPRSLFIIYHS